MLGFFYFLLQNPHVVMQRPVFTVGQGRQCDLSIGDASISKTLCNLRRIESEVCLLCKFVID